MSKISDARDAVLARDDYRCVAIKVDRSAGWCYDRWGLIFDGVSPTGERLEMDRIKPTPGSRMPSHSDPSTLVALCPGHHRGTGPNGGRVWATRNRPALREYLRGVSV